MHFAKHLNDKIKKLNYLNHTDNNEIDYDPNLNNSQIEQFEILKQLIKNQNKHDITKLNIDQSSIRKTSTSTIKSIKTKKEEPKTEPDINLQNENSIISPIHNTSISTIKSKNITKNEPKP